MSDKDEYALDPYEFEIETSNLLLKPPQSSDIDNLYEHYQENGNHLGKWGGRVPTYKEVLRSIPHDQLRWIDERAYVFNIWLHDGGVLDSLIGRCVIDMEGEYAPEAGIWIDRYDLKQGYGKEASLALINFAFNTLELPWLIARVDEENVPTLALLKSLKFKPNGKSYEGKLIYKLDRP